MPLFQSESKGESILMWMSLICMKMKQHAELIFIWKVPHLDSFWNRGSTELGIWPINLVRMFVCMQVSTFIWMKTTFSPSSINSYTIVIFKVTSPHKPAWSKARYVRTFVCTCWVLTTAPFSTFGNRELLGRERQERHGRNLTEHGVFCWHYICVFICLLLNLVFLTMD